MSAKGHKSRKNGKGFVGESESQWPRVQQKVGKLGRLEKAWSLACSRKAKCGRSIKRALASVQRKLLIGQKHTREPFIIVLSSGSHQHFIVARSTPSTWQENKTERQQTSKSWKGARKLPDLSASVKKSLFKSKWVNESWWENEVRVVNASCC